MFGEKLQSGSLLPEPIPSQVSIAIKNNLVVCKRHKSVLPVVMVRIPMYLINNQFITENVAIITHISHPN